MEDEVVRLLVRFDGLDSFASSVRRVDFVGHGRKRLS